MKQIKFRAYSKHRGMMYADSLFNDENKNVIHGEEKKKRGRKVKELAE